MCNEKGLTLKQQTFLDLYLSEDPKYKYNGTQSALKAFNIKGDTKEKREKTASAIAVEYLGKPLIRKAVDEHIEEKKKRSVINEQYVLDKLQSFSEYNVKDLFEYDEESKELRLKRIDQLPRSVTDNIVEITQTKDGIKYKLADKKGSVVDLGRYLGMFTDNLNVREDTIEDYILDSHKGAEGEKKPQPTSKEAD